MTLQDAWEDQAGNWVRWAREPGHDSYWRFHREPFLSSLPAPARLTLDVGCGEGRVTRDLRELGHRVFGVDLSPTMIRAARAADPDGEYIESSTAALPFDDGEADLVVAFMTLMDMDDMPSGVREIGRVLKPGGWLAAAVVHPMNSAGAFSPRDGDETAPFVVRDYSTQRRYSDSIERHGFPMTFQSIHFTLEDYSDALEVGGFVILRIREIYDRANPRWSRVPLFLRIDAEKA